LAISKKYLQGVGRGVLRFWEGWYRKPRSNFGYFWDFGAGTGIGGVDIIYCVGYGVGYLFYGFIMIDVDN